MFTEIVGGASLALSIYASAPSILQTLSRFHEWIRTGTRRVPVFGAGGTGKTTLGKFLAGAIDPEASGSGYRESIGLEQLSIAGRVPAVLLVPPGQASRRPETWPDLYRLLSRGDARGVINVVSWGYHSTGAEYRHHEVYETGITPEGFLESYLEFYRQREIAALKQIVPHLKAATGKTWMITLVTKQDLWWRERQAVERHYKEGEYESLIEHIVREKGREGFVHNYFSVCLVPQNLRTRDGTALALTTAGYDEPLRIANLKDFLEGLSELLNSE